MLEGTVKRLEQEYRDEKERMRLQQPNQEASASTDAAQEASTLEVKQKTEAEWIKRDRENAEFERKKRHMLQSRRLSLATCPDGLIL
jgi:ribonuclease HI